MTVERLGGFVAEGEGNQSAAPLFANPAANDLHQLPGSPTIDAGIIDPALGRSDPDGDLRLLGAAPDIGADEYVPPESSPAPPPPTADPEAGPVDRTRPAIRRLSMTRRRFALGRRATPRSSRRVRRGTAFRVRLSEAARISIRLERVGRGRRLAHAGTLRRAGSRGPNRIRFSGRIGRRALRPGGFRALVRARDAAGNVSRTRRVRFRVVRLR